MTTLSRFAIHAAICWLIAGSGIGAAGLGMTAFRLPFDRVMWVPVHMETMLFGWLLQMVIAVAWWMLPRWPGERNTLRAGVDGRGRASLATTSVVALNAGVMLAVIGHLGTLPAAVFAGRLLALSALATFVALVAPRVRAFADG